MNRTRARIAAAAIAAGLVVGGLAFGGPQGVARTVAYGLSDGRFSGKREYAYYGFVRVEATVKNGRLADVRVSSTRTTTGGPTTSTASRCPTWSRNRWMRRAHAST